MTWFRCRIRGENFPGALVGETHPIGFYTTRYVEAATSDAAEMKALSLLKQHQSLHVPEGVDRPKDAKVYFDEIVEVRADEVSDVDMGLSFFAMEE